MSCRTCSFRVVKRDPEGVKHVCLRIPSSSRVVDVDGHSCVHYVKFDDAPFAEEPYEGFSMCSHCREHEHDGQMDPNRVHDCKVVFVDSNGNPVGQCSCWDIAHGVREP